MMIRTSFKRLTVPINYCLSAETLAMAIGVNGQTHCEPSWNVIVNSSASKALREIVFFMSDDEVMISQVPRRMSAMRLRPVVFPEFVAVIKEGAPINDCMVCLGTMWGEDIGQKMLISSKNNLRPLVPVYTRWVSKVCFPAIHYSGPFNLLPGMKG